MLAKDISIRPNYPLNQAYRWVDYYELVALLATDGPFSSSDLKDQFNLEITELDDGVDIGDDFGLVGLNEDDEFERRQQDIFRHFESRSKTYHSSYPFSLEQGILLRASQFSDHQMAYLFLLCCSQLGYFTHDVRRILTSDFEIFCNEFLSNTKPMSHGPYLFGKNSSISTTGNYVGNIYSRLSALADDMNCILTIDSANFSPQSTGDEGVDIVGWDNPWDKSNSQFVYLGNCKCSESWEETRNPSDRFKPLMQLNNGAVNLYFIPFHFRHVNGRWFKNQSASGRILYDRSRLIGSFPLKSFQASSSFKIITSLLNPIV